jgi:hypothetical protein
VGSLKALLREGMRVQMMSYSVFDMKSARRAGRLWVRLARVVHYVGGILAKFDTSKLESRAWVLTHSIFGSGERFCFTQRGVLLQMIRVTLLHVGYRQESKRQRRCACWQW